MVGYVVVPILVLTFFVMLRLQFTWNWYPFQYVYFMRFPLLSGILLVFLWTLGISIDLGATPHVTPGPFFNLFALDSWGIGLVSFLSVLAAWTILHSGRWVYARTPDRLSLTFRGYRRIGPNQYVPAARNVIAEDPSARVHLASALLAAPLLGGVMYASEGWWPWKLAWIVGGLIAAFFARYAVNRRNLLGDLFAWVAGKLGSGGTSLLTWLEKVMGATKIDQLLQWLFGAPADNRTFPTEADPKSLELADGNLWRALGLALAVYAMAGVLLYPGFSNKPLVRFQGAVPALVYVLLLQMLVTWVVSWSALRLDRYRVPAEVVLVAFVALVYALPVTDTDHYYNVLETAAVDGPTGVPLEKYLTAWSARRKAARPILIAASGGGITAAAWTATVLAGLQRELGPSFPQSIALISTTSGGGVGAMYYVERFADAGAGLPPQPPGDDDLKWTITIAARSSLGAMEWGLIYPDFARMVFPPLAFGSDRGWAIERRWGQPLEGKGIESTLRQWQAGVAEGWRPAQVFNATFAESGARYLISPLVIQPTGCEEDRLPWRAVNFVDFYPRADMRVTTAARLSATFPFVTPVARPTKNARGVGCAEPYHVADGGYFDNFGVMTAVEFADHARGKFGPGASAPLVVEIRASGPGESPKAREGEGFRMETIGPLDALLAVRTTSQVERGQLELQLLRQSAEPVPVRPEEVHFDLRTEAPLSWHLSLTEQRRICAHWEAHCPYTQDALRRVAQHLYPNKTVALTPPRADLAYLCNDPHAEPPTTFECPWLMRQVSR